MKFINSFDWLVVASVAWFFQICLGTYIRSLDLLSPSWDRSLTKKQYLTVLIPIFGTFYIVYRILSYVLKDDKGNV